MTTMHRSPSPSRGRAKPRKAADDSGNRVLPESARPPTTRQANGRAQSDDLRLSICDAKIAGECALVTLTCDDPKGRGLGITIDAIETGQLVKWLEAEADGKAGMQVELEGLSAKDQPAIGEMSRNSAGAGWRVTFYAPFTADLGLPDHWQRALCENDAAFGKSAAHRRQSFRVGAIELCAR